MTAIPTWIEAQLPAGARRHTVAASGEHVHVLSWGPDDGATIVLVHGNPMWGFLWRKVVAAIRTKPAGQQLRLLVPDLVGLGLSSRPPSSAHTLANHGAWLGAMIDKLAPGPLVLVGQDWGGPIGLRAMTDRARRLRGLVLANTVIGPPPATYTPSLFHRISHAPVISDVLFRGLGFPMRMLHHVQGDRRSIRGDVARAYRWPLRRPRDRTAPLALARMVPITISHPTVPELEICERTFRAAEVPVALVWGTKDPVLGRVVNHIARVRPDASVVRTDAGHFLQEEVPEPLAAAVLDVAARARWS